MRLLIAARGTLGLPPSSMHFVHYPTWKVFVFFICDRLSLRLHTCAAPLLRLVVGLLELCESQGLIPSSYWL